MEKNTIPSIKPSILDNLCTCEAWSHILRGEGDDLNVRTNCPKCGKNLYHLQCPVCMSGFCFDEDSRAINVKENHWFCEMCKKGKNRVEYDFTKIGFTQSYYMEQIPKDIRDANKSLFELVFFSTKGKVFLGLIILAFIIFNIYSSYFDRAKIDKSFETSKKDINKELTQSPKVINIAFTKGFEFLSDSLNIKFVLPKWYRADVDPEKAPQTLAVTEMTKGLCVHGINTKISKESLECSGNLLSVIDISDKSGVDPAKYLENMYFTTEKHKENCMVVSKELPDSRYRTGFVEYTITTKSEPFSAEYIQKNLDGFCPNANLGASTFYLFSKSHPDKLLFFQNGHETYIFNDGEDGGKEYFWYDTIDFLR